METLILITGAVVFTALGWLSNTIFFNIRNRNNEVYVIPKHVVNAMTEYMEELYEPYEEQENNNEDREFNSLMKKFEEK
jgi:hypothetical protein